MKLTSDTKLFKYFCVIFSMKTSNLILPLLFIFSCEDNDKENCIDESKISDDPCIEIYDPVCGCDKKTYSNYRVAENAGVMKWTKGKCD